MVILAFLRLLNPKDGREEDHRKIYFDSLMCNRPNHILHRVMPAQRVSQDSAVLPPYVSNMWTSGCRLIIEGPVFSIQLHNWQSFACPDRLKYSSILFLNTCGINTFHWRCIPLVCCPPDNACIAMSNLPWSFDTEVSSFGTWNTFFFTNLHAHSLSSSGSWLLLSINAPLQSGFMK